MLFNQLDPCCKLSLFDFFLFSSFFVYLYFYLRKRERCDGLLSYSPVEENVYETTFAKKLMKLAILSDHRL